MCKCGLAINNQLPASLVYRNWHHICHLAHWHHLLIFSMAEEKAVLQLFKQASSPAGVLQEATAATHDWRL